MPRKGSLTRRNRSTQTLTQDNRVVLYVRASTPEQVNSLDAQQSAAARFAERHELAIDAIFIDSGVSAVSCALRDRPQAAAMLRHCKLHSIRTILVLRVDRAFRSTLDFSQTLAWARNQSITFRFIDPDIDLGTPIGEMFIQIQVALAQMECGIRSARVDEGLDSLRSHRLSRNGKRAPYGWHAIPCTDGTRTRLGSPQFQHLPIPAEQAVLRHILTAEARRAFDYYRDARHDIRADGIDPPTFEQLVMNAVAALRRDHSDRHRNRTTIAEAVAAFLKYKEPRIGDRHAEGLKGQLGRFAKIYGTVPVDSLTGSEIDAWVSSLPSLVATSRRMRELPEHHQKILSGDCRRERRPSLFRYPSRSITKSRNSGISMDSMDVSGVIWHPLSSQSPGSCATRRSARGRPGRSARFYRI